LCIRSSADGFFTTHRGAGRGKRRGEPASLADAPHNWAEADQGGARGRCG
jgi:hypothetical protein